MTGWSPWDGTGPLSMEAGHAAGTGGGAINCGPELAMASCLIQRGMANVAKLIWSRVKSEPDPA